MDRKNKPSIIPISPSLPQPVIDISDLTVTATLPTQDSVTVHLFGATVTSWTTAQGQENLFLSSATHLDGSKPIRGGIPIVFPVFGPPPKDHATGKLPQHGFARSTLWEFLGKNTSESQAGGETGLKGADEEVRLDFGLSSGMLSEDLKGKWPYDFGLVYSVTLGKGTLETGLHVQNKGTGAFEFQALFHNYFKVEDISQTSIQGLAEKQFFDKVTSTASAQPSSLPDLALSSNTDRVYSSLTPSSPLTILSSNKPKLSIARQGLTDCTVWNPWEEGAKGMKDFEPKTGFRQMVCVEPGSVKGWVKLEAGDAWEGSQYLKAL